MVFGDTRMTQTEEDGLPNKGLAPVKESLAAVKEEVVEAATAIREGIIEGTKKTFTNTKPTTSGKESVEEPDCEHYMQDLFCPKRPEGTHGPNVCRPQAPWSCWRTKKEGKCLKTQANARATAPVGQDNMRPVSGVMADTFKGIDKGIKKMFPTKEE